MRIVTTNAHKNPIVFDHPWLFAEDEEIIVSIGYNDRSKKGERLDINVPRWREIGEYDEPRVIVSVGIECNENGEAVFFVDESSDATESTERIYEHIIPSQDEED